MNNYSETKYNIIESLISIFTIEKGEVKVLLYRKKDEPYRGYWLLPGSIVSKDETIEENLENHILDTSGFDNLYMEQFNTFSNINRMGEQRIIATSFIGLIDSKSVELRQVNDSVESAWFNISAIPKVVYDHEKIINKSVDFLRSKIINSNILKILFPSDFTLPELQRVYEQILDKELDRRNFRKKFVNFDLIEDTGYKNEGYAGRPAKLYQFKDEIIERDLF